MPNDQTRTILLLGCGRMGSALLEGWIAAGLPPASATVLEPSPGPTLQALTGRGVRLNPTACPPPEVCLLAVKPQVLPEAIGPVARFGGGGTLFVSIAAGIGLDRLGRLLGPGTPIVRAMPNTPAAIGRGITALVANDAAGAAGLDRAAGLMAVVGETVTLADEAAMDAVTAVSGSGPAYVFALIEALEAAAIAEGLAPDLARRLAVATVAGAGALAAADDTAPEALRRAVTSPGGTTEAGLGVLLAEPGLPGLIRDTVRAAAARSRALGG